MSAQTPTNHDQSGNTTNSQLGDAHECKKRGHPEINLAAFLKSVLLTGMIPLTIFLFQACSSKSDGGGSPTGPPTGPSVAEQIRAYLTGINPVDLDVQATVANAPTGEPPEIITRMVPGFGEKVCTITPYNLSSNLEDIAILRPTQGIVWPGALVKGDRALLNGVPTPISLDRSPITLSIDLPGFTGGNGTVEVANPTNASVQDGINESLDWWNRNARANYDDSGKGYVNPANTFFKLDVSYSQDQSSLALGLGGKNAVGVKASAAFDQNTDETETILNALYMQTFYTVTVNTPRSPEAVFAPSVTLSQVQGQISAESPGAYIQSVAYGRIILVRMRTKSTEDTDTIKGALNWVGKKGVSVETELEAKYKNIILDSSIELFAIGGNAETTAELVNIGTEPGALAEAITGKNALYTENNPGVPIAYTVRYLKDNALAKLGYTTNYNVIECRIAEDIVDVTFNNIQLIADCRLFSGSFYWKFSVKNVQQDNTVIVFDEKDNVDFDDVFDSGLHQVNQTRTMNLQRLIGNRFEVILELKEKNSGTNFAPRKINHTWDQDWRTGLPQPLKELFDTTVGASRCAAEFRYTVKKG